MTASAIITQLHQCWKIFCKSLGVPYNNEKSRTFFVELTQRYSEPHRYYHTLLHINSCLSELGLVRIGLDNPLAVEMALWYHDAVYDTHAKDNEDRSADLAGNAASQLGMRADFCRRVRNLIVATRHDALPIDRDAKYLADIDLSILGANAKIFDQYDSEIRKEYDWVPKPIFREKRTEILQAFLDRPRIYCTDRFRDLYETEARQNLKRAIDRLRQNP